MKAWKPKTDADRIADVKRIGALIDRDPLAAHKAIGNALWKGMAWALLIGWAVGFACGWVRFG